jgi:hypothetical protein
VLTALLGGTDLTADEAAWAMDKIMRGEATDAQIAAFAVALRAKGETVGELTGLVRTMYEHAETIEVPGPTVDIVGTGGDRARTVNISTMSAIVVAGTGARVAKHGNRAASSASGASDVLVAWQRADDGTATGALWADSSGNGNDAIQPTAANQPVLDAAGVNFNPAFNFNGSNNTMFITTINHDSAIGGGAGQIQAEGTVEEIIYFGETTKARVRLKQGPELIVKAQNRGRENDWKRGDSVTVWWNASDMVVLQPDDDSMPVTPTGEPLSTAANSD